MVSCMHKFSLFSVFKLQCPSVCLSVRLFVPSAIVNIQPTPVKWAVRNGGGLTLPTALTVQGLKITYLFVEQASKHATFLNLKGFS